MKQLLLIVFTLSTIIFFNCNNTNLKPAENLKIKSVNTTKNFSIKPLLKRHAARVDSTIKFGSNIYKLMMYQRLVKEEAVKICLDDDTIYCNQSQIELNFYKNNEMLVMAGFKKTTFERLLDEKKDSLVWGHKGIDSVTNDGIFVTLIIYKPIKNQYYNLQFAVDLFGTTNIWHIFDNINGNDNKRFIYDLNNVKIKINPNLPEYSFYLYTHDDTTYTYYDSITVSDEHQRIIQTIYFGDKEDENELRMIKQYASDLDFTDLNFDNNLDMRLFVSSGSKNYYYICWLYDKKNNRYKYSDILSGLSNVEVDTVDKLLTSCETSGMEEYDCKTFIFSGENLILLEREIVYGVYETKPKYKRNYLMEEKYKRINGKIRLISKKKLTN
jgi:hypothetical protein